MGISSEVDKSEFVYGKLLYNIPMHSEKSMLCELCKSAWRTEGTYKVFWHIMYSYTMHTLAEVTSSTKNI
jgi:hypothetical protein